MRVDTELPTYKFYKLTRKLNMEIAEGALNINK